MGERPVLRNGIGGKGTQKTMASGPYLCSENERAGENIASMLYLSGGGKEGQERGELAIETFTAEAGRQKRIW